jgi:hypothetical protein
MRITQRSLGQVSNVSATIKITCDFLSVESLSASFELVDEFRAQRLIHHWPDDVLQLETTLWHAWNTLSEIRNPILDRELDALDYNPAATTLVSLTDPIVSTDSEATGTMDSEPVAESPHPDDMPVEKHCPDQLTRQEQKRQKRQAKKQCLATTERPHKAGHDFRCLFCPRTFHKGGLLDHL